MRAPSISPRRFRRQLIVTLALLGLVSVAILMPGVVGAALKSSHPAIPTTGESLNSYHAQGTNGGTNPLIYNGGTVITSPQAYLIFEGSYWGQTYSGTQTNMQRVQQYFGDVSGSALEGILTQYYYQDASGTKHYISNTISVAGSVLDTTFDYSGHCQGTNLLYDPSINSPYPNDITNEITKEIQANNWTNTSSTIFFVFTPPGYTLAYYSCTGLECAYHANLAGYTYAAMNWGDQGNCSTDGNTTDTLINEAMHEQFEAITNPLTNYFSSGNGWYEDDTCLTQSGSQSCTLEIGDKCGYDGTLYNPPVNTHPGVYLNGTTYDGVQGAFSNATGNCEYTVAPPPPTPTPTNTPVPTCSVTNETDNIQPSNGTNPYVDNRGNTWYVYYDIKRDAKTNAPCQMQLVVRIFNPAPNGAWSGTASLYTLVNGNYDSASFGKVSGSCTYQYHFVWRGPWFKAGSAYYHLETFEYNGSNAYTRAWANFSI